MTSIRCSRLARDQQLDPVGSAGSYDAFLLVEHRLPWASDFVESPGLGGLDALVRRCHDAGLRLRVQGLLGPSTRESDTRTVVLHQRPEGMFDGFRSRELVVPAGEVVEAASALVEQAGRGGSTAREPGEPDAVRDVLLCTHGTRDRCCGSEGTALHRAWEGATGSARLWRTSHTGGHRYAPTALTFPEGLGWAYLDEGSMASLLDRSDGIEHLVARYRGCCGIDGGPAQALERELFSTWGWEWLAFRRAGGTIGESGSAEAGRRVFLEAESPAGERYRWEATVAVSRHVPIGDCGGSLESSTKTCPEYEVESMTRLE